MVSNILLCVDDTVFDGVAHKFAVSMDTELAKDVVLVSDNGLETDVELPCYFEGRQPFATEDYNLPFAWCKDVVLSLLARMERGGLAVKHFGDAATEEFVAVGHVAYCRAHFVRRNRLADKAADA